MLLTAMFWCDNLANAGLIGFDYLHICYVCNFTISTCFDGCVITVAFSIFCVMVRWTNHCIICPCTWWILDSPSLNPLLMSSYWSSAMSMSSYWNHQRQCRFMMTNKTTSEKDWNLVNPRSIGCRDTWCNDLFTWPEFSWPCLISRYLLNFISS